MDSQMVSALIVAVVGGVVASGLILLHSELEKKRERKSVATALLWEIDDFYKLSIRNVCRALKDASPSELGFYVKPLNFRTFTVFEMTADKVGLFEPPLVQAIVGFYGVTRAYMDTLSDYGQTIEQIQTEQRQQPVLKPVTLRGKAVTLLDQIKKSSTELVPLTRTVCEGLAEQAKVEYTFEVP